ncbi:MAG: META and DUF4377 domain-containing protein [Alcaligenaceae bacterium]|nr:META and DUF4377 domain-containing protein [Alcaligenaceae bacterium]
MNSTNKLTEYHWHFSKALKANGDMDHAWSLSQQQSKPLSLNFAHNSVGISGLCNAMGAEYQLNSSSIKFDNIISTQMYCSDKALMDREHTFSRRLPTVSTWQIQQGSETPHLILTFDDGAQWLWEGIIKAETKYGNAAEIVFLEVAPQTKPCIHPLLGESKCLQTRTVDYNERGLKQSHGNWQNFYQTIQNYEHTPGLRQVLRLKRFDNKNARDNISRYVFILDMVVESELLN